MPGVVYGGTDGESTSFKVDARVLRQVLVDGSALIDLRIDGGNVRPVIVKDQQVHPVREQPLHIDLLEVRLDEKIEAPVAVHVEGVEESPGVKEGGVLEQVTRELNIEALPGDIPDSIVFDVSGLEMNSTATVWLPSGWSRRPRTTQLRTTSLPGASKTSVNGSRGSGEGPETRAPVNDRSVAIQDTPSRRAGSATGKRTLARRSTPKRIDRMRPMAVDSSARLKASQPAAAYAAGATP